MQNQINLLEIERNEHFKIKNHIYTYLLVKIGKYFEILPNYGKIIELFNFINKKYSFVGLTKIIQIIFSKN